MTLYWFDTCIDLPSQASQICESIEGFLCEITEVRRKHSRDLLSDAFRVLLNDSLHALERREPMLIVLNALDQSMADAKSEFVELIADKFPELPTWIKLLILSRQQSANTKATWAF